jgi:hypothetical protein
LAGQDEADITELISDIEPQSARGGQRHWGKREAANVVGKCWSAIEAVAAALLERGILTGDELKRIVDANVSANIEWK